MKNFNFSIKIKPSKNKRKGITPLEFFRIQAALKKWPDSSASSKDSYYKKVIRDFIFIQSSFLLSFSELKKLKTQKQDLHIEENISIEELKKDLDSNNKNLINSTILLNQNVEKINISNNQLNFFEKNNSSGECKHCKQELTKEHKDKCINDINLEIKELNNNNIEINKQISSLKEDIVNIQKNISLQEKNNKILSEINFKIKSYEEKYIENKSLYEEYNKNINSSKKSLEDNSIVLNENKEKLKEFESSKKIEDSLNNINTEKQKLEKEQLNFSNINLNLNNKKSVQEHSLVQRKKDLEKIKSLINENENLSKKITIYPSVIQAFGSSGIPALIIQNMLDDLQVETNNLLNQLKPGLQLSFSIEKTKTDGTQDETLDIEYFLNGKSRDYEQLSGAMKIIVTFSLKLGLSFLLQKITGANIKMLLLDEIDQPLDKAGIDALYDIIKFFQKDFTILVITHNDRMKQKFNNGILVEQDINGTSVAKVVESW